MMINQEAQLFDYSTRVARTPINQLRVSHCSAKIASRIRKPRTTVNISRSRVDIAPLTLPPMHCSSRPVIGLWALDQLGGKALAVEMRALCFGDTSFEACSIVLAHIGLELEKCLQS